MELGISTACFYPIPLEDTLERIHETGFGCAELFFNCAAECKIGFVSELKRRADSLGIKIVSVHSYTSAIETFLLFSSYERRTQEGIDNLKNVMDAGSLLGAKYITFHGKRIGVGEIEDDGHYCNVLERLMCEADRRGVVLAQENVSWCESSSPEFLDRIQNKIGKGRLKFTLDIKQTKRAMHDIEEYIRVMAENIVNVHINDFDEKSGCLLPGRGEMDYPAFFNALKFHGYDGALVTEVYSHNYQGIDDLARSRLFLEEELRKNK